MPGLFVGHVLMRRRPDAGRPLRDPDLGEAPIRSLSEVHVVAVVNAARVYVELGED